MPPVPLPLQDALISMPVAVPNLPRWSTGTGNVVPPKNAVKPMPSTSLKNASLCT